MKRAICLTGSAVLVLAIGVTSLRADPVVPGHNVEVYADVTDPILTTFAPSGVMYVGRDNRGSGGGAGDAVRIHRVGTGGSPVVEYGAAAVRDPDVVLFDGVGVISGTPGSVLVGSGQLAAGYPGISAILPDESVATVFDLPGLDNFNDMQFDSTGRLLFIDRHNLLASTGGTPTILVWFGSWIPVTLAVGANDEVYLGGKDGVVRVYDNSGNLVDESFTTGTGYLDMDFAPGGVFGTDLYALDQGNGQLLRLAADGTSTVIGSGFGYGNPPWSWISFGPDGALYVSDFENDRILRIVPEPIPGDCNGDGKVNDLDAATLATYWQYEGPIEIGWEHGDFNDDGKVTDADAAILAAHWQEGVGEQAASVPEPSTLIALLSMAVVGLLAYKPTKDQRKGPELFFGPFLPGK